MATCAEPIRLIPGPTGTPGANGTNGTNGINAYTTLSANFTMPAIGLTSVATVVESRWAVVGESVYLQGAGTLIVTAVVPNTSITLQNPSGYPLNVAGGMLIASGNKLGPGGLIGPSGSGGSSGSGVTVAAKGDIQTRSAVGPASQAIGSDGQMPRVRAGAGNGWEWATIVPNAAGAADDNKIAVANSPVGTEAPVALQLMPAKVTDTGAYQTVGGNARGVDATDLQAARTVNTQVASGNNSTIGGGRNNTSSAQGSTVSGGEGNVASGADATVAGGANNVASGQNATVAAGNTNIASGIDAFVAGGNTNIASGDQSSVLSGIGNSATGQESVAFGGANMASGFASATLGGATNTASGALSVTIGGIQGNAPLFGQVAHASLAFSVPGDAQVSELLWHIITTDATPNVEMFLNGISFRAVLPVNTTWGFHIIVSARRSNGDSFIYEAKGGIKNDAGNCVLVGAITEAVLADGTGGALTVASIDVDADNTNDSLRIRVTGIGGQNWRWVAHARLVECGY